MTGVAGDQRRSATTDAAWYLTERIVRLALGGVVGVVVARHLGPEQFGLFAFAITTFAILAQVAVVGMPSLLVRDFSTVSSWQPTFMSAVAIQTAVGVVAGAVGAGIVVASQGLESDAVATALLLSPLPVMAIAQTFRAWLEANGLVALIVAVSISTVVVVSCLRLGAVFFERGVPSFAALATFEAALLYAGFGVVILRRPGVSVQRDHVSRAEIARLLKVSYPLLLAGIAVSVYMTADILMLGWMTDDAVVGVYAAAARLSEMWYFVPVAVLAAARPRMSRIFAAGDLEVYRYVTRKVLTVLAGLALVGTVLTLIFAGAVVDFLFGPDYGDTAAVLRVHILAAPFVFLGVGASQVFIDRDMTRVVMARSVVGAVVNVVLNLVLIPSHGAIGAAIATLVSYAMSGVLLNGITRRTRWIFYDQLRALVLLWPSDKRK